MPTDLARLKRPFQRVALTIALLLLVLLGSTVIKIWPQEYFWIERSNARMPVWVRGKTASGVFIVFNHGGPGSSGTLESILEAQPADGRFDRPSPFQALESEYAMVYWDQRHSGMSGGSADPDDSRPEDFGEDLALVIRQLRTRYDVRHVFLIGQSWGHTVALSYLALVNDWQQNQANVSGYVVYKGNHEQDAPFQIARGKLLKHAEGEIAAGRDAAYWQKAIEYYQHTPSLRSPADYAAHNEYVDRAMGVSVSFARRAWTALVASVFSPFNGWRYYLNNRRTTHAERFMSWVITSTDMRAALSRVTIPTLLIYGENDLVAPPEIGQAIAGSIATPEGEKSVLVLPHSRHGAEGPDVAPMQKAVKDFIDQNLKSRAR